MYGDNEQHWLTLLWSLCALQTQLLLMTQLSAFYSILWPIFK